MQHGAAQRVGGAARGEVQRAAELRRRGRRRAAARRTSTHGEVAQHGARYGDPVRRTVGWHCSPMPQSDPSTVIVPFVGSSGLALVKTGTAADINGDGIVTAGDGIRWSFTVTNSGVATVSALKIVDPMVDAVRYDAVILPPRATVRRPRHVYMITSADAAAGRVVNTATATALGAGGVAVASAEATAAVAVAAQARTRRHRRPAQPVGSDPRPARGAHQWRGTVVGPAPASGRAVTGGRRSAATRGSATEGEGCSRRCCSARPPWQVAPVPHPPSRPCGRANRTSSSPRGRAARERADGRSRRSDARPDVAIDTCQATDTGWSASGTATNPAATATTYTITVFFTTDAGTVIGFADMTAEVAASKTGHWTVAAEFGAPASTLCIAGSPRPEPHRLRIRTWRRTSTSAIGRGTRSSGTASASRRA